MTLWTSSRVAFAADGATLAPWLQKSWYQFCWLLKMIKSHSENFVQSCAVNCLEKFEVSCHLLMAFCSFSVNSGSGSSVWYSQRLPCPPRTHHDWDECTLLNTGRLICWIKRNIISTLHLFMYSWQLWCILWVLGSAASSETLTKWGRTGDTSTKKCRLSALGTRVVCHLLHGRVLS